VQLTGDDFTVMVKVGKYSDRTEDLNGIYWHWAENILAKESYNIVDPVTGKIDPNQNLVVNVRRGLNNYGFLKMYGKMSKLLD